MTVECGPHHVLVGLRQQVQEHVAQEAASSEPQQVLEAVLRPRAAAQLGGRHHRQGEDAGEADQHRAEDGPQPLGPVGGQPRHHRGWS